MLIDLEGGTESTVAATPSIGNVDVPMLQSYPTFAIASSSIFPYDDRSPTS